MASQRLAALPFAAADAIPGCMASVEALARMAPRNASDLSI